MRVLITKSFWHGETRYEKGQSAEVSNNVGHGLVEAGFALKLKEFEEPPKDKMIKKKRGRPKLKLK